MRQVAHVGDVETEAVVLELVGVVASLLLRRARAARYDRGLAPHGLAVRYSELCMSQPCWEKKKNEEPTLLSKYLLYGAAFTLSG